MAYDARMARDYAQRSASAAPLRSRKQGSRKPRSRKSSKDRAATGTRFEFSAPSFSAGAVFGAALVVILAWVPEALDRSVEVVRTATQPAAAAQPELEFHFEELLQEAEVTIDPGAYPAEFEDPTSTTPRSYLLQAASFKRFTDAEALRVKLRTLGMPATTEKVTLDSGTWYRVTVGPFTTQVAEQRALTRLRENNLAAYRIKKG